MWRSAKTNKTKLKPYPKNPTMSVREKVPNRGNFAPRLRASAQLTPPATKPLIAVIWNGSEAETLCVRLLSMPQHTHAPAIKSAPSGNDSFPPVHDNKMPPATIATMPSAMRRSKFSRNTNHAKSAVATPSRLSSSEATEAGVVVSPHIKSSGPHTPPKNTAPPSQGQSARVKGASRLLTAAFRAPTRRAKLHSESPKPEPR